MRLGVRARCAGFVDRKQELEAGRELLGQDQVADDRDSRVQHKPAIDPSAEVVGADEQVSDRRLRGQQGVWRRPHEARDPGEFRIVLGPENEVVGYDAAIGMKQYGIAIVIVGEHEPRVLGTGFRQLEMNPHGGLVVRVRPGSVDRE